MALELAILETGDTNYVGKHNANYAAIASAIAQHSQALAGQAVSLISTPNALVAMFGDATALIGSDSYECAADGTDVTVQPGLAWVYPSRLVALLTTPATISMSGRAAGTYYVIATATGAPDLVTAAGNALYAVAWNGAAITAVDRVAPIVWGAADFSASQSSDALAADYLRLDDRLEAGESAPHEILEVAMADADQAVTDAELAQHGVLLLTGTITANRVLTIPDRAKVFAVRDTCAGAFTITVKTSTGTGPALVAGEATLLVCDGEDTARIAGDGGATPTSFIGLTDVPSSYAGEAGRVLVVNGTEDGLEFSAAASPAAFVGLTDTPADYTDDELKLLRVNAGATAVEFVAPALLLFDDFPNAYTGEAGKVLAVNLAETGVEFADVVRPDAFIGLVDAPASYAGYAGLMLAVNEAEDGLEFTPGPVASFTDLEDCPTEYTGEAGKLLAVNGGETGIEFVDAVVPTSFLALTDAPDSYSGAGLRVLTVLATEDGIGFSDMATPNSLLGLLDAVDIDTYVGKARYLIAVNDAEDGVEAVPAPAHFGGSFAGEPGDGAVLLRLPMTLEVTFATNFAGSLFVAGVAADDVAVFTIAKDGMSVGTVTFAAAGTTGTFASAGPVTFEVGDVLTITAPATADATLADLGYSLAGAR